MYVVSQFRLPDVECKLLFIVVIPGGGGGGTRFGKGYRLRQLKKGGCPYIISRIGGL